MSSPVPVRAENRFTAIKEKLLRDARPYAAQLELTYVCNLDCRYCYNVVDHDGRELSTMEWIDVFRKLADANVLYLTFTGGEPLARRDFFTLGHAARDLGFALRIYTNAHVIDARRADRIASLRPMDVETSIHGACAPTHEAMSLVPGSFGRLLTAVRHLRERGIRVTLKCAVTRLNQAELRGVKALGDELGCPVLFDTVLIPRMDGNPDPLALSATEEFLARYWSAEMDDLRNEPIEPRAYEGPAVLCGTGRASVTLDPYGNVFPCIQWRRHLGNLRDAESLEEIWTDANETLRDVRGKAVRMAEILSGTEHGAFAPYCLGQAQNQTGDPLGGYRQVEVNARLRHGAYEASRRPLRRCSTA